MDNFHNCQQNQAVDWKQNHVLTLSERLPSNTVI